MIVIFKLRNRTAHSGWQYRKQRFEAPVIKISLSTNEIMKAYLLESNNQVCIT